MHKAYFANKGERNTFHHKALVVTASVVAVYYLADANIRNSVGDLVKKLIQKPYDDIVAVRAYIGGNDEIVEGDSMAPQYDDLDSPLMFGDSFSDSDTN